MRRSDFEFNSDLAVSNVSATDYWPASRRLLFGETECSWQSPAAPDRQPIPGPGGRDALIISRRIRFSKNVVTVCVSTDGGGSWNSKRTPVPLE